MNTRKAQHGEGVSRAGGFTLVELLVVMLIIMVLVGILLPTLQAVRIRGGIQASQAIVNAIESAARAYRSDHGIYPPSGPAAAGSAGGQLLAQALVGAQGQGSWDEAARRWTGGDGEAGLGFRLEKRGPVFGPYHGADGFRRYYPKKTGSSAVTEAPFFADYFNNPVLYYCFESRDGSAPKYTWEDNPRPANLDSTEADRFFAAGANASAYVLLPNGQLPRRDILLLSAGPDNKLIKSTRSDDITNFRSQ